MTPDKCNEPNAVHASLLDTVFESQGGSSLAPQWRVYVAGWILALAVHASVLWLVGRTEPSLEMWSARMAALVHRDLAEHAPITIEETSVPSPAIAPPPPPDPLPPAKPVPAPKKRKRPRPVLPRNSPLETIGKPAPPAQAGNIVTQADSPSLVDLTGKPFVTGAANAYVGGATASDGTNRTPVSTDAVDRNAAPTSSPGTPSHARPVRLSGNEWRCDWPQAALSQDIYEQFVVLRVIVRANGSVEQATVLDDPGHGFGAAAVACAQQVRFTPARDPTGRRIRATSPPIRVRFTR